MHILIKVTRVWIGEQSGNVTREVVRVNPAHVMQVKEWDWYSDGEVRKGAVLNMGSDGAVRVTIAEDPAEYARRLADACQDFAIMQGTAARYGT